MIANYVSNDYEAILFLWYNIQYVDFFERYAESI